MIMQTLQRSIHSVYVTHTSKIFVQELHISVDDLQRDELIVLILDRAAEIQTCISTI